MTLEMHATPEEVMRAVEKVYDLGRECCIGEKDLFGLALALEECASNIVNHALRRDARQTFRVTLEYGVTEMRIELRDQGPAFDPTRAPVPETNDEERSPGGWGIKLVRQHVDQIRYRREDGENVLCLTKRLHSATGSNQFVLTEQTPKPNKPMPIEILIMKSVGDKNPNTVTVKLTGSLDTATAPELERQLAPVLNSETKDLVFDLSGLKFISSAGLRVFSTARKQIKERGGQTSFVNMQPQIQEVFAIMQSLPGVAVFKDVAELDRYLAVRQRSHEENR
jgi:anti-anti-sigma factor